MWLFPLLFILSRGENQILEVPKTSVRDLTLPTLLGHLASHLPLVIHDFTSLWHGPLDISWVNNTNRIHSVESIPDDILEQYEQKMVLPFSNEITWNPFSIWGGNKGATRHVDYVCDVLFTIQLTGSKSWILHQPQTNERENFAVENVESPVLFKHTVKQGEALLFFPYWPHETLNLQPGSYSMNGRLVLPEAEHSKLPQPKFCIEEKSKLQEKRQDLWALFGMSGRQINSPVSVQYDNWDAISAALVGGTVAKSHLEFSKPHIDSDWKTNAHHMRVAHAHEKTSLQQILSQTPFNVLGTLHHACPMMYWEGGCAPQYTLILTGKAHWRVHIHQSTLTEESFEQPRKPSDFVFEFEASTGDIFYHMPWWFVDAKQQSKEDLVFLRGTVDRLVPLPVPRHCGKNEL